MPRGVAIPELREQLFQAAERLLVRDGPGALSSRAITAEAGCAKGILHNHFTDLDGFLAEFVLDRFGRAVQEAARLPAAAGEATVAANLTDAVASLFGTNALALAGIVMSRPSLVQRIHDSGQPVAPMFDDLGGVFAAYLEAEKKQGRIMADADTEAIGLALIASAHHLFITTRQAGTADGAGQLRRIVDTLLTGATPPPSVPNGPA